MKDFIDYSTALNIKKELFKSVTIHKRILFNFWMNVKGLFNILTIEVVINIIE